MSSLNDFIILGKIGEGAYSSVHKVKRISDSNIYALKKVKITTMKEKEKQNSLNEVRILASIQNEYIIGYKQAFFDSKSNTLCIIMEFAQGGDLQKIIDKKKRNLSWVSQNQIWKMIRQVLSGLLVLHQMNIIHRDIKCANIFVSDDKYKLGDLNVSKILKQNLAYTQTGTPYYASPQVWNDKPYQLKSDIWSLGCVIYQYCSLKPPFTATSMQGLFKKVMRGIYPKIPGSYSQQLEKFISHCLQLDPKNRYSCKQLINSLPESKLQNESLSNVSLLNTIRVPRNLQSWRQELPKSNYTNQSNNSSENKNTVKNRFGNLSQQKLKQIVRQKNQQSLVPSKKSSLKRITPQIPSYPDKANYHSSLNNQKQRLIDLIQEKQKKREIQSLKQKASIQKKPQIQVLPRIKIYSEPTDNSSIMNKLREQQRNRKYNYNRPTWWG